jgi:hypothetical protein
LTYFSHISEHGCTKNNGRPHFSINAPSSTPQDAKSDNRTKSTEHTNEAQTTYPSSTTPKPEEEDKEDADSTSNADDTTAQGSQKSRKETPSTEKLTDPLRWFGILVPPALRTAQSTFVGAVEGAIPQLATVVRDLRAQEIEIGRLRKQIKKM